MPESTPTMIHVVELEPLFSLSFSFDAGWSPGLGVGDGPGVGVGGVGGAGGGGT